MMLPLLIVLLELICTDARVPMLNMTRGEVWPLPQEIRYLDGRRPVPRKVNYVFEGVTPGECDILRHLVKKTAPLRTGNLAEEELTLVIRAEKCPKPDEYPQQGMNEEYRLNVPLEGNVTLEAAEVWGILRGFETFTQLIYKENGTYILRTAEVHDWPEYSFRGTLIDTSRHYLPIYVIFRHIRLMAQNKFNVLHWHIVDSPSFPYVSERFPKLSEEGAFSPDHVYTRKDIKEVIDYARLHGIRVMVEVDTPGHVGSWTGQPGFLADCYDASGRQVPSNLMDPTNGENYEFLRDLFEEVLDVLPENFVHLGGDESWLWADSCWLRNPKISAFMEQHGFKDNVTALEDMFLNRWLGIIKKLFEAKKSHGRMVFWQDVFDSNNVNNEAIINVWRFGNDTSYVQQELSRVTKAGYQAILSSCWYFDKISFGRNWIGYYKCDPRGFPGTPEEKKLVIGGVAALWGEYVDATNFESRMWPHASAAAERLWSSPKATKDYKQAWPRLYEHRCRMIARGYRAQPVNGPGDFCPEEFGRNRNKATEEL